MAMIAVEMVLEKLTSLISEEAQLLGGLPKGIEELRDDLDSMKSFLQDAEARSENDHGLNTWVKQVRDVAYDTEDVLEEFLIRFSLPRHHGFVYTLRNCYLYIRQLRSRHRLAVRMQHVKQRVRSISERRAAFSLNITRLDEATSSNATVWTRHDPRLASLYIDEADIVGIEKPKNLLIKWMVEGEEKLTAISVVGMGGLGKTTLVKKAFDSQVVKRCFDCHAWVTVSKSFTVTELLQAMLKGILEATKEPAPEALDQMKDLQLIDALRNHLQQKRYVIVFDDVWNINAWEAVKYALPDCNSKSRVVFTTRSADLAASMETTCHVYHLQPLPEQEAWTLFCMKAFRGEHKSVCPKELERMSHGILKKCGGLPLAIVLIGGILSSKNENVLEWRRIHDSLATNMRSDYNLESLGRIILLSYDDLPYYLKSCYLYVSVFPEDYLIKRMKLVRLWVVERFVQEKPGLTLEEVAEEYLNELVSRSMIQVVDMDFFNRVRTCRIHDIVREIIQQKSKDESLVTIVNERSMKTNDKVRRLAVHENCEDFPSYTRFPHLRSLLVFTSKGSSISLPNACFHGFKFLRLLELELAPLSQFPLELVELIHLRYLSLRRTMIWELPDSIKKLQNLETLDLKGTHIPSLPVGILQLKHLRQIRNYYFRFGTSLFFPDSYGMRVPLGIGRLTNLEKLGCVEVDDKPEIVRELGNLTQLRRLGILKIRKEDGIEVCSTLQKLTQLTGFYMVSIGTDESLELNSLVSPPPFLQRLYLKCPLPNLPKWIASLQYLSKLVLQYSNLKSDPLNALQGLTSLVVLELRGAYDGEELCCAAKGYPRLKKLSLYELQNLKCIRVEEGAMPELRGLDIASCGGLETMPLGIENLKNLQNLLLWDMPSSFFEKIKQPSGEDYWMVQHIQTITRIYESRGTWAVETIPEIRWSV